MRAQVILSLAVVFTFWFVEAAGQTRQGATSHDAIELGATKLSIGMPQDSVIAKLAEEYKVEKEGGGWLIEQKEGPPFPPVANIAFENGKLQEVRKYWGPEDQAKGVEFATTLYGLIASFSEEGEEELHHQRWRNVRARLQQQERLHFVRPKTNRNFYRRREFEAPERRHQYR